MIACAECEASGIEWVPARDMDPHTNVWRRHYRTADGQRGVCFGGDTMIGAPEAWSFPCRRCHGRGVIEWRRGKSLVPVAG